MTATSESLPKVSQLSLRNTRDMPRRGSFTEAEKFCLRRLFLDDFSQESDLPPSNECTLLHKKNLDDTVLFQVPIPNLDNTQSSNLKFGRHEKKIAGLWRAHEDGVHPVIMNRNRKPSRSDLRHSSRNSFAPNRSIRTELEELVTKKSRTSSATSLSGGALSVNSDVEVRPELVHDEQSSWPEDDGGFLHYDAWEVLNDE
jgi:hypothetical protein